MLLFDINKIVPERVKTLDEVKGLVTDIIKKQKQQEAQNDLANAIYQKLESGSDLSTLAGKYELIRDQEVSRNSSNIPTALIEFLNVLCFNIFLI